ncbi:MAG: hypothetical protein ACFE0Q_08405 [Anaerolineae bacterium]
MIIAIKLTHSLIIIYMMLCLLVIWEYALTGIHRPFVKWAFLSIIVEGVVFIISGFVCPLTSWALALGDETGADLLSEWLLLDQVNYTGNFALFFVTGTLLSVRHLRR